MAVLEIYGRTYISLIKLCFQSLEIWAGGGANDSGVADCERETHLY